jgi:hypothetical protein
MKVSTPDVLDWALRQRRVRHPMRVTFRAFLPIHGKAYWTEIQEIDRIGYLAEIDATIGASNAVSISIKNAKRVAIRPESELFDMDRPVRVSVNGKRAFEGTCSATQEIRLTRQGQGWIGSVASRKARPLTAYRTHKIGTVVAPPTQAGPAETSMGSWMADMMRDVAGTDVAVYNRRHYRGVPFKKGQDVYLVDLLNWIRPCNRILSTFEITGKGLIEIIEDNIRNDKKHAEYLVQVSGCRYAFDRTRPKGKRIVRTDIDPDRKYTVVCEGQVMTRGDTFFLAGRFEKLPYTDLEPTNISAAWRYIDKCGGRIEGKLDGRVTAVDGAK